ncbi:uncharacterized protein [Halyomorpha halys]|uniref:uncharacterized protein n=1 Tax=Halyomorpha halys TaxID=286706 RepID=UPI0006D51D6C|nr:uncharacterized protein LOC106679861 [Halyomorpha halys]
MENMVEKEVAVALESHFAQLVDAYENPNFYQNNTTHQISEPLCQYIKQFEGPREVLHKCCKNLVVSIVEKHKTYVKAQKNCNNILIHMLLYVAARVASCSEMPNTEVVVDLLSAIFDCDKSFRNLLMGAYFEPDVCFLVTHVQSVFSSLEEGLGAYRYFLQHTNKAKKYFVSNGFPRRMVDTNLQEAGIGHPAVFAIANRCLRTFKLLVEHGTNLDDYLESHSASSLLEMIQLFIPENNTPEVKFCREVFTREHPEILAHEEQTLMMLSRKAIRRHLNREFELPSGIDALPIPGILKRYLHLDLD